MYYVQYDLAHLEGRAKTVDTFRLSVVFSDVHEVGRGQGVLTTSVVFSTVHEVGREQGVLTISACCFQYCT